MAQQIAQQKALEGVLTTHANCEKFFGGATYQLQQFDRIGIPHLNKIKITGAPEEELDED